MTRLIKVGAALLLFASCNTRSKSPEQYLDAIESDDDLHTSISMGDIRYHMALLPPEYFAAKYALASGKFDAGRYKDKIKEIAPYIYCTIAMSSAQDNILKYRANDYSEFQRRLEYFTNYASHDVVLVLNDKDTITPVDYIYENNLGVSSENKMVLVFKRPTERKKLSLLFNDRIFNNYNLKLSVASADVEQLPQIKY